MAPISLKDNKIPVLIDQLVYQLTKFKKLSRNFTLSSQFALSNFRYHKYLDVNSLNVTRLIDGVVQKFEVHSQYEKVEALQSLCQTFLNTPLNETDEVKTDAHYALISLLLVLSNSPSNYEYTPREKTPLVTVDDGFDWKEYLLGDAEEELIGIPHSGPYLDWSDDDLDSDTLESTGHSDSGIGQSSGDDRNIVLYNTTKYSISSPEEKGRIWLADHVVSQYWHDYPASYSDSQNISQFNQCSLARTWQTFQRSQDPFYQNSHNKLMTETQLVKETIWMLSGVENCFVYKYHKKEMCLHVRDDIQVSHLTLDSLQSLLATFAKAGEQSFQLVQFKASILEGQTKNSTLQSSMTMQAFANSLSRYFKDYKAFLSGIEKDIIEKESTVTLLSLQDKLGVKIEEITVLHSVYEEGVVAQSDKSLPQTVTHLLDTFYHSLKTADSLGDSARWKVSVLLSTFLETICPCLEFIDSWVTSGIFKDPVNEFFIFRDEAVPLQSNLFWDKGITLTQYKPGEAETSSLVPCFLSDLLQQVLLAGKSVNVIQGLGKMAESFASETKEGSLYQDFVDTLLSSLSSKQKSDEIHNCEEFSQDHIAIARCTDVLASTKGIHDPMLKTSLMSCSAVNSTDRYINSGRVSNHLSKQIIAAGLQQCMVPITVLYKQSLFPLLQTRCTKACSTLVVLLKSEYNLMEHLEAMRNFYLLEAGATMHHFYLDILKKVRRRQSWQDISYLNSLLQEALHPRFPQFIDRLTVSLSPSTAENRMSGIQTLHSITLHYKIPWPVSLVIDEFCVAKYNQVFLFLLTVKQVKWCLDSLRFTDLSGDTNLQTESCDEEDEEDDERLDTRAKTQVNHELIHKMYLLRFKLLHFVNSLHNYIMTRILHVTGLEFKEAIVKAENLNDIIAVHRTYVEKVFERCLLSQKVGIIKEAITKVFHLVLLFQAKWDASVHELSEQAFQKIDKEFSKCNHFLITFLGNIVKRGSFPHLESLAFSLSSSLDTTRLPQN